MGSQNRRTGWARGGLVLALLLAWPGAAGSQTAEPDPASAQGLQISWSPDWTATDIVVAEKDVLHIIVNAPEQDRTFDGPLRELRDKLAKSGELYAFTGRIGDGPAFKVEPGFRRVMTGAGRLWLRWDVPREYARLVPVLNVGIEVERAPKPDPDPDPDPDPVKNIIEPENLSIGDNETAPAPEPPTPKRESGNISVDSAPAGPSPESGEEAAPAMALWSAMPLLAGSMALLLLAAAAAVSIRRWRRRKLVKHTRSLLALSPKLDLGEGACRGGSLPAEGPAASLRARLEEGAMRCVEGGEDG